MLFNYLTNYLQKHDVINFLFGYFYKNQNAFADVLKTQRRHFYWIQYLLQLKKSVKILRGYPFRMSDLGFGLV